MLSRKIFCLGVTLALVVYASADEPVKQPDEEHDHQNNIIPQSTAHPRLSIGDLTIPNGLMTMLANGGVVAAMVVAVGLLAMLIAPTLGFRLCSVLGNCPDAVPYQAYSAAPNAAYSDYQGYQQGTYNNPVYQKRSLEYIGPILKALGNAYEKYSRQVAPTQTTTAKSS